MNLRQIIAHYDINGHERDGGTDKDTFHSYIEMYEQFLSPLIDKPATIAEVGIQYGGSMLLWQDYLPKANFIYLDNVDAIHPKIREHLDLQRAKLLFEDAYTEEAAAKVKKLARKGIDVIIDDGPHTLESQCKFLSLYLLMALGLKAIGAKVDEREDGLIIDGSGGEPLEGNATVTSALDHRIAMSFAVAGQNVYHAIHVDDVSPIATSFPTFEDILKNLQAQH